MLHWVNINYNTEQTPDNPTHYSIFAFTQFDVAIFFFLHIKGRRFHIIVAKRFCGINNILFAQVMWIQVLFSPFSIYKFRTVDVTEDSLKLLNNWHHNTRNFVSRLLILTETNRASLNQHLYLCHPPPTTWMVNDAFLPAATKLGQGNVFTGVCDSIHRGGVCLRACWDASHPLPRTRDPSPFPGPGRPLPPGPGRPPQDQADPPRTRQTPPGKQTPVYGQWAAGTHPTGMHSCLPSDFFIVLCELVKFKFFGQDEEVGCISWLNPTSLAPQPLPYDHVPYFSLNQKCGHLFAPSHFAQRYDYTVFTIVCAFTCKHVFT